MRGLAAYLPVFIIGNSLTTTKPPSCAGAAQCVHFLSPWTGLALLSLYAAVALAVGCWLFVRRDA
jgi:ABC-2 type transport system permease protein